SGLGEERRKVRLPNALGQPGSERPLPEDRVNTVGQCPDLADTVAPGDADEYGLVIASGEELDLSATDEVRKGADDVRTVRLEPVEERTREVQGRLYLRMAVKRGHERGIGALGHLLEH